MPTWDHFTAISDAMTNTTAADYQCALYLFALRACARFSRQPSNSIPNKPQLYSARLVPFANAHLDVQHSNAARLLPWLDHTAHNLQDAFFLLPTHCLERSSGIALVHCSENDPKAAIAAPALTRAR